MLNNLEKEAKTYSIIINNAKDEEKIGILEKALTNLDRIGGSPSYLLLMKIISNKATYKICDEEIGRVIDFLVKFFVRRSVTDFPNTRNLNKLFMDIIASINGLEGEFVIRKITEMLIANSSDDETFKTKLEGPLYQSNSEVTRFLLCYYEDKYSTKEIHTDLWERGKNGKYIWTIEHIFPEGENIPQEWIDMIANGDENLAYEIYDKYVHVLGNLTITGYNSNLSNAPFEKKKEHKKDGIDIGYKNGLKLNEDVYTQNKWTKENIEERSKKLVATFVNDFSLKN